MAHIFHWKHGWIPLNGASHKAADHARAERFAASRSKNADKDAARAQRLAAHRNPEADAAREKRLAAHRDATAGKEADRRIRYLAAQNRKTKS